MAPEFGYTRRAEVIVGTGLPLLSHQRCAFRITRDALLILLFYHFSLSGSTTPLFSRIAILAPALLRTLPTERTRPQHVMTGKLSFSSFAGGLTALGDAHLSLKQAAELSVVPVFVIQANICSPALVELSEYITVINAIGRRRLSPIAVLSNDDSESADLLRAGAAITLPVFYAPSQEVVSALFSYDGKFLPQQLVFYSPTQERVLGRLLIANNLSNYNSKMEAVGEILRKGDSRW